MIFHMV